MYLWQYVAGSVALTTAVTVKALALYPNFYAAMLSISGNSASLCVFLNQTLCILWLLGKVLTKAIFGELRLAEIEYIYQRFWFLSLECVIMVSNLSASSTALDFGFMTAIVAFSLVFHWVLQERAKVMFQMLTIPTKLEFIKIWLFNAVLLFADFHLCTYGYEQLLRGNKLITLLVPELFELLQISIVSMCHLVTDFYEAYLANLEEDDEWEAKGKIMLFIQLGLEAIGLMVCAVVYYALGSSSINLIVNLVIKFRQVFFLFGELRRFLSASSSLESWVSDPTLEDIARDNTCVICREEMDINAPSDRFKPRKMQCGHIIHFACLKSWLGRSQNCPTCRQPVKSAKSAFVSADRQEVVPPPQAQTDATAQDTPHPQQATQAPLLSRPTSPQQAPIDTTDWVRYATRSTPTGQEIKFGDNWYNYSVMLSRRDELSHQNSFH